MKILLTGGAGYIGSHTCIELINAGYEPVIADNFLNSKPEVINRIEEITGKRVPVYELDVADFDKMDKLFCEQSFDAVIHFAGLKAVGESVQIPVSYYRNNLDSTLTLLEVMAKHSVNKIVFSSSATVYGVPKTVPLTETMPTGCTNPYGWTKYMIEQILTDAANADSKLSVVLLRYFNPIGAHKSGRIGEDPRGIPNNLIPYITQVAAGKLPYLNVFGNDYPTHDGTGVRDYIHVTDLARGHVCAIDYADKNTGTEIFNLGTGVGYSVLDIVNTFERVNNIKIPYEIKPRRPGDVAQCYANAEKAQKKMNWKAEKTLDDMCKDSWNWQKNNPNGYTD
ncbi:MAG: UDP-glucose 4-epimerase GalE [Acutalibacteraceae bacterium]